MLNNPIEQFIEWYKDAKDCTAIELPEAMSLSTVNDGYPDSRVMLLKQVDKKGFVFYTNYHSSKGRALAKNQNVCMLFFWEKLKRQVRIRGSVEKTQSKFVEPLLNTFLSAENKIAKLLYLKKNHDDDIQSDVYFKMRSRESQIGAWASNQSQEIKDRTVLEAKINQAEEQFKNKDVLRPPHWGGYRLVPNQVEFWTERKFRLHERILYIMDGDHGWKTKMLSP